MVKLNREDVLKLAKLARLELTEAEINNYQQEISQILAYVEQLQSVDTAELAPTNQVTGLVNVMRQDKIIDYGYAPHSLLDNVPAVYDQQLQVKRMVE